MMLNQSKQYFRPTTTTQINPPILQQTCNFTSNSGGAAGDTENVIKSIEYNTSAAAHIEKKFEEEPVTSPNNQLDDLQARQQQAHRRKFDPVEYSKIRN